MKVVIAPDKFKGSLSAAAFCKAARKGILEFDSKSTIIDLPLSDGGDGFCDVLNYYGNYEWQSVEIFDPLFRKIQAAYLSNSDKTIAYIEMARSSGLELLSKNERNCMYTSSFGLGQLIESAIDLGSKEIFIGLGGSATNDAGIGMATALGFRFFDEAGYELRPIGKNLDQIYRIDFPKTNVADNVQFTMLSDVYNPLFGLKGAAHIYSGQKGASPDEKVFLDKGLMHFDAVIRKQIGLRVAEIPGAGAAGGLGAAGLIFLNATLSSGANYMLEHAGFNDALEGCDLLITGEGRFDSQSYFGKLPALVAERAAKINIPALLIAGQIEENDKLPHFFDYAIDLTRYSGSLQKAKQQTEKLVQSAVFNFVSNLNN